MAEPARHLHILNPDTGEVTEEACPACAHKADVIEGLEAEIRSLAAKLTQARRDKEREAREHPLWPTAIRIFHYWRERCSHPKADWGADRFELIRPILQSKGYGDTLEEREAVCRRAIDGAAFDPFVTTRRNGSRKRHDGWELIFRDRGKLEEFCNRAPREAA